MPELERWVVGVHHVVHGFARWHARAPRYASRHLCDAQAVEIAVVLTPDDSAHR